jgi:hypothetical protein
MALPASSAPGLSWAALMWLWLRDHILPGLITTALVAASHLHLRLRIRKLTAGRAAETGSCSEQEKP